MVHTLKNEDRNLEVLMTAGLIQRFAERRSIDEIYRRGIGCYEVLLDVIEKPEVTRKVAEFAKKSLETTRADALKIVGLLLFNRGNNPFLSLGLPDDAEESEIKKRWKRLLMLYHPDRAFNQKGYEEIAKKINQAYEKIAELKEKRAYNEKSAKEQQKSVHITMPRISSFPASKSKYLQYLPSIILVIVIFLAILSITLFIIYKID